MDTYFEDLAFRHNANQQPTATIHAASAPHTARIESGGQRLKRVGPCCCSGPAIHNPAKGELDAVCEMCCVSRSVSLLRFCMGLCRCSQCVRPHYVSDVTGVHFSMIGLTWMPLSLFALSHVCGWDVAGGRPASEHLENTWISKLRISTARMTTSNSVGTTGVPTSKTT